MEFEESNKVVWNLAIPMWTYIYFYNHSVTNLIILFITILVFSLFNAALFTKIRVLKSKGETAERAMGEFITPFYAIITWIVIIIFMWAIKILWGRANDFTGFFLLVVAIVAFLFNAFAIVLNIHKLMSANNIQKFITEERVKKLMQLLEKINRNKWNIIALVLTIFSIWFAYYLSSPINLQVWHNVSASGDRLEIYAKNNDWLRSTGTINLYRIEQSDSKPHIQLTGKDVLKLRQEKLLANLSIVSGEETIKVPHSNTAGLYGTYGPPASKLYFVTEHTSISYKITCDACPAQGIVRRIPTPGEINLHMDLQHGQPIVWKIPTYAWLDYNLSAIM